MEEFILATFCIAVGVLCALMAAFGARAHATGEAFVSFKPILLLGAMALLGIGGGVTILVL